MHMNDRKPILFAVAAAVFCLWLVSAVSAAVILATDVFLLSFLGILFAVFLTKCSRLVTSNVGLSYGWSLGLTAMTLVVVAAGLFYFVGQSIEQRVQQASPHIDDAADEFKKWINQSPVAKSAVADLPFAMRFLQIPASTERRQDRSDRGERDRVDQPSAPPDSTPQTESSRKQSSDQSSQNETSGSSGSSAALSSSRLGQAVQIVIEVFQSAVAALMNVAIVLFVGLFLAASPALYRDGVVRLFPRKNRPRIEQILNEMGRTLWSWLLGRFASMLITGLGTGIGLAILGVPLPFVLGGLTGLLTFIPNIGPAIGLALSVLVALPQGGNTAVWVIVVFLGFQILESYVVTPLIQHRQVSIPPAALIVWQVVLGLLAGFLGIAVSTPILAVLFVLVRMAYLEDVLGKSDAADA